MCYAAFEPEAYKIGNEQISLRQAKTRKTYMGQATEHMQLVSKTVCAYDVRFYPWHFISKSSMIGDKQVRFCEVRFPFIYSALFFLT